MDKQRYSALTEDEIGYIDQFIFRFSSLQDVMGDKLFVTLLANLGEDYKSTPFVDLLNRLERLALVSTSEWISLRKTRNNIAHEYSFNIEEVIQSLNLISLALDRLLAIYHAVYGYCVDRFDFVTDVGILKS